VAVGHNGNLINSEVLRHDLESHGFEFNSSTDTEIIAQMLASAPGAGWQERVTTVMRAIQGAYCLIALTPNELIAMRDPYGVRPLCWASSTAPAGSSPPRPAPSTTLVRSSSARSPRARRSSSTATA